MTPDIAENVLENRSSCSHLTFNLRGTEILIQKAQF